jgi:hypothetical protein
LYSAIAPETVLGAVFLPALLFVEYAAGPGRVAEVSDFRLVSVPSMFDVGVMFSRLATSP